MDKASPTPGRCRFCGFKLPTKPVRTICKSQRCRDKWETLCEKEKQKAKEKHFCLVYRMGGLYNKGWSYRRMSKELGVSVGQLTNLLRQAIAIGRVKELRNKRECACGNTDVKKRLSAWVCERCWRLHRESPQNTAVGANAARAERPLEPYVYRYPSRARD